MSAERDRTVLLMAHTGREDARQVAREAVRLFTEQGMLVRILTDEANDLLETAGTSGGIDGSGGRSGSGGIDGSGGKAGVELVKPGPDAAEGCELVVVLGGDGTILRGAELARSTGTPILGVNLGHIGFLAEAERDALSFTVDRVVSRDYAVEERMTVDVTVRLHGETLAEGWALNEASVEKASRDRMVDLIAEIDDRALSRWGCDGVVMATPTGSTAYAFSAGGPIVWPDMEALLMVPISAHALFARPLVVSPASRLAVTVQPRTGGAVLWCDGRRTVELPPGSRVEVGRGRWPVLLARLHEAPFTDRLVAKFALPVAGWRGVGKE